MPIVLVYNREEQRLLYLLLAECHISWKVNLVIIRKTEYGTVKNLKQKQKRKDKKEWQLKLEGGCAV